MNKKEKKLAMSTALMNAAPVSIVVPELESKFTANKTKVMREFLQSVGVQDSEKVYMMLEKKHPETFISGRNIATLSMAHVGPGDGVDMLKLLQANRVIYSGDAFDIISERYSFDKRSYLWRMPADA
jgi:ribosomal protein L4